MTHAKSELLGYFIEIGCVRLIFVQLSCCWAGQVLHVMFLTVNGECRRHHKLEILVNSGQNFTPDLG